MPKANCRQDCAPQNSDYCQQQGLGNRLGRLPARPTSALPGTPDKIAVMAERAARGESLFHPQDASLDGEWALIITPSQTGKPIVIGQINQRTRAVRLWPRALCSSE